MLVWVVVEDPHGGVLLLGANKAPLVGFSGCYPVRLYNIPGYP